MKRFLESLTLLQLILLGFAAVILPLTVAIGIAVVQSEEFATSSRDALATVQTSTDTSRRLTSKIRELERSARQYIALDDAQILGVFRQHRLEVLDLLAALRSLPAKGDIAASLDAISTAQARLNVLIEGDQVTAASDAGMSPAPLATADTRNEAPSQESTASVTSSLPKQELDTIFDDLRYESALLLEGYSQRGRELSNDLAERVSSQRSSLVLLAVMVVPLSLVLAGVFLVLARRPLRQLDSGIRSLGDGTLAEPIEIGGARDLVELGRRLEWLRKRLIALEGQKMRFLRDVSHELKTPLTNIREASALLLDESSELKRQETATITRILHENGLRLQSLIEELLRVGAADGGGEHEPLALHELVSETVRRQTIAAKARRLELNTALSPVCVRGNSRQIDIVVDNLLSNAIKFSPERGRVDVRLSRCGTQAQLDVVDDGPGVAQEHQGSIFDWFFRGDTDHNAVVAGSGMGLAIASEYARLHAGTLQLMPSDHGAHFRLSLGVADATAGQDP